MPATHRKGDTGSRLSTLQQRARAKPVDNFASINTYYRSADLLLRQVLWCGAGVVGTRRAGAPLAQGTSQLHSLTTTRSSLLLILQADVYRRAHNEDELYVMLLRFAG